MKFEKIISYIFHPVILGVIATAMFFVLQPKYIVHNLKVNIISIVFISTFLIPVIFLFILKKINAIKSFHLSGIEERKFPVFFFIVLDLLLAYRLYQIPNLELLSVFFSAGSLSLIIVYIFLLLKRKISLHTLGFGLFTAFVVVISYHFQIRLLILISLSFIASGFVAMSRLKLKAHNNFEVYFGFILGFVLELFLYLVLV